MAFRHGVYKSEVPTSLISPTQGNAGLPVVIGTSPVFMGDPQNVNKPVLCYSYSEAVKAFGFVHRDWDKYTLCEFIYSQFALFGQSPVVLINVFDPSKHKEAITDEVKAITNNELNLGLDVIISAGITFKSIPAGEEDESTEFTPHFTADYDADGNAIVTFSDVGLPSSVKVSYTKAKPDMVTASDIIGGVNAQTGEYTGLELVDRVFPKYRLVPGIIAAPGWSHDPSIAAIMAAKSDNINGLFTCISVVDIPSDNTGAKVYSAVPEWKTQHNYVNSKQIVCWPKVKLGDDVFHLSTQLIGLMNRTDNNNGDIPYESPSNKLLQIDSTVDASGKEILLGHPEAVYLNSQGIVTALNFMSGWVAFGNWTGIYPNSTDPKDSQICIRRMFDFVGNTFIQTFWQMLDGPLTVRLVRSILNSFNVYLNSLSAREYLLGGRIEFLETENPTTDLQSGTIKFHIYMTPPPAAAVIEGIFEFDPDYFSNLVSALG